VKIQHATDNDARLHELLKPQEAVISSKSFALPTSTNHHQAINNIILSKMFSVPLLSPSGLNTISEKHRYLSAQVTATRYVELQSSIQSIGTSHPTGDKGANNGWQSKGRAVGTLYLAPSVPHLLSSFKPWPKRVVNVFNNSRYRFRVRYVLGSARHPFSGWLAAPFLILSLARLYSPVGDYSLLSFTADTLQIHWSWQKKVVNTFSISRHRLLVNLPSSGLLK